VSEIDLDHVDLSPGVRTEAEGHGKDGAQIVQLGDPGELGGPQSMA